MSGELATWIVCLIVCHSSIWPDPSLKLLFCSICFARWIGFFRLLSVKKNCNLCFFLKSFNEFHSAHGATLKLIIYEIFISWPNCHLVLFNTFTVCLLKCSFISTLPLNLDKHCRDLLSKSVYFAIFNESKLIFWSMVTPISSTMI